LDESVLVKEEQSSAFDDAEDKSWDNEDEEDSGESEKRFITFLFFYRKLKEFQKVQDL
jgi:hypothetical protein